MSSMAQKTLPCGRPTPSRSPAPDEAKLEELKDSLKKYLSRKKLKFTEQRWTIASIIFGSGGHLDAQEILSLIKASDSSIGAATVYRNIKVLCDAGLLEMTHQNMDGRDVYELPDEDHHDHILCVDCGVSFEFNNKKIESLQEKVATENEFRLTDHRHVIQGSCEFLRAKRSKVNN